MLKLNFKFILLMVIIILQLILPKVNGQIRVGNNGYVGIGSPLIPNYKLDVNSSFSQFYYTPPLVWGYQPPTRKLQICFWGTDPRIYSSTSKVVFYSTNGFIDVQCRTLIETSDSTLKEDIQPISIGALEKVLQLNGVSYKWKKNEESQITSTSSTSENEKRELGFLAQDVENIIPEVVYTNDSSGSKSISYTHIIPLLTEAIKELNDKIELLENQLSEVSNKSALLNTNNINNKNYFSKAYLSQNIPNPFNQKTEISYFIPGESTNAMIIIHDMQGTEKKQYPIIEKGNGKIIINAGELIAGMYTYSLIIDNKLIDTKKMLLTKNN